MWCKYIVVLCMTQRVGITLNVRCLSYLTLFLP